MKLTMLGTGNALVTECYNTCFVIEQQNAGQNFFLGEDYEFITNTINSLNGRIHLVIGNHDTPAKVEFYKKFDNIVEISWATQIKYNKRQFYLSHYPTQTADLNSDPKTCVFNIYGHVHSKEKFYEDRPYMYCVALDAQDNKPVNRAGLSGDPGRD